MEYNASVIIKKVTNNVTVRLFCPLTAMDICSQMENGRDAAWLSTVYRILELFIKKGVVIKTNVMNNEMAVYELNRFKHKHYAACMNFHKVT